MNQEVRFSRLEPEQRKALLIEATLACLKRHGFQGASVRKICAEAGVSVGLINHHYDGKDALVAEAYLAVTGRVMRLLRGAIDTAPGGARPRLSAFFEASFSAELLDPHCSTPGWRSGVRWAASKRSGGSTTIPMASTGRCWSACCGNWRRRAAGRTSTRNWRPSASAPCSTGCGWSLG